MLILVRIKYSRKFLLEWHQNRFQRWYLSFLYYYSNQGSTNRLETDRSEIFWNIWSWSELVRDFPKIFGPGPTWSGIFGKYLVLVRVGPRFLKSFRSWSGLVLDFPIFFGPGSGPWIPGCRFEKNNGENGGNLFDGIVHSCH